MKLQIAALSLFVTTAAIETRNLRHNTAQRVLESRIINGVNAKADRYPYTVSLQAIGVQSDDSLSDPFHFCGGSLIAPDIVLSAAHCAEGFDYGVPSIAVNPHNLVNPIQGSEVFGLEDYVSHPLYATKGDYDHDFMIIKLDGISSLPPLLVNAEGDSPVVGSSLVVMGWGTTDALEPIAADILQEVGVVAISNSACAAASSLYQNNITPDSLCALEANQGSCQGDSGGPLIIAGPKEDGSEDMQVGVVSWGVGCAETECKCSCHNVRR